MGAWRYYEEGTKYPVTKYGISDLVGKTLKSVAGKVGDEEITFETVEGGKYRLIYHQDCCAGCSIEDICGNLSDLIGTPILKAEEVSSGEPEPAEKRRRELGEEARKEAEGDAYYGPYEDSETWTFYHLATVKGAVTLRWYGSSNGYYSETATFERWVEDAEEEF